MIKRLCICLSLIMLMCTLSGCQTKDAEIFDAQQENQVSIESEIQVKIENETEFEKESSLYQTSQKTVAELVQAPGKFEYSAQICDSNWVRQFDFDAEIVLPDVDGMDVVAFELKHFSEEDIVKIAENVFPKGYQLWTQEEINTCTQYLQGRLDEYKKEIQWNESEVTEASKAFYDSENSRLQSFIWENEFVIELFNASKCTIAKDFTCVSKENANGEVITVYMSLIKDDEHIGSMYIINDCVYYWWREYGNGALSFMNNNILPYIGFGYHNTDANGAYQEWMCKDIDNQSSMSEDDIDKTVQELLSKIGMNNYRQHYISPEFFGGKDEGYVINFLSEEKVIYEPAFITRYVRDYEGVNIVNGTDKYTLENNTIIFNWYMDNLYYLRIQPVVEVGEVISDNVELLPFARIEESLNDYFEDSTVKDEPYSTYIFNVKKIALEYVTVFDETSSQGILIPAWNVYTRGSSYDSDGTLIQESDTQMMSINAIDGSVLWFNPDYSFAK